MQITTRRGRPRRTSPDNRTPAERRAEAKERRHKLAAIGAASFAVLPDQARVRQPVVELLFGVSSTTLWRRVRDGLAPLPRRDGGTTYWLAGDIRRALGQGAQ